MVSKQRQRRIAEERIDLLFDQAADRVTDRPELSDRYMEIARAIAMRYTISFSREQRMRFCQECGAYLEPGVTARVRVDDGEKRIRCDACEDISRFPYSE